MIDLMERNGTKTALAVKSTKRSVRQNSPPEAKNLPVHKASPQPDTTSLDHSLGYSLRRAQLSTFLEFASAMKKHSVRPSQYAALVLIGANPGLSQSAVSVALGIQKANFVALIDGLESRGLTERRRAGGDRRMSALYLTRTGEAFVRRLERAHNAFEARLRARLGDRRSQQLLNLLHQFCSAAE
jgi:DNA-binding MarR family transcriptional regulator